MTGRLPRGPAARAAGFGLVALALYLATLCPGLAWGDSAQLQRAAALPKFSVGARDYPLWTALAAALARLLPVTPALAANLLSALCGAAAVALTHRYVEAISESARAAAVAAASTIVAHLFWSSSVAAEVYSLALLMLVALLLLGRLAVDSRRAGPALFGAAIGICLLHHRMLLVAALGLSVILLLHWSKSRRGPGPILATLAGFGVGATPFFALLGLALLSPAAAPHPVLLGGFSARLPFGLGLGNGLLGILLYELKFLAFNLAGVQFAFAVVGLLALRSLRPFDRRSLVVVGSLSLLQTFFFPQVGDRYMLLLPAIWVACVLAGLGSRRLLRERPALWPAIAVLVVLAGPVAVYLVAAHSSVLSRVGLLSPSATRQATEFLRQSRVGGDRPRRYAQRILKELPADAVLVANWGEGEVIRYLRDVEGHRPDLVVRTINYDRDELLARALETRRPVFLSAFPLMDTPLAPLLGVRFDAVLPGVLWRVVPIDQK